MAHGRRKAPIVPSGCSSGVERNLAKVDVVGSNPIIRSNFFITKGPHRCWWCAGFILWFVQKNLPPYCNTVPGNNFHLLWWGPPDVPPPCISWKCCRKAASVNVADVAGYHRRILYYCLMIQYLSSGTQADLMITGSRTCRHLSYAEWYNANQVSSSKHSNIRWRISDSFIPATFYSLLTARLTIRSVFVQSTLSWTIPQIERSCSWTCRVYSTTLPYGFPSHRRQKSECFCRIALHKL